MTNQSQSVKLSELVVQCTREQKGNYITAAQRRQMKLIDWVKRHLDKCAKEELEK